MKINRIRKSVLLAVFLICTFSSSAEQNVYIGIGIGNGDLDIDSGSFPEATFVIREISGESVLVTELSGGYRFDSNWTLDLGFESYDSINIILIGDVVDLRTIRVGGGYHFPGEGRISGFVKGGLSFWDIDFRESFFLNPGPEETASRRGNDVYFQAGAELQIHERIVTRLTYDFAKNDFGDSRAIKLWLGAYF